MNSPSLSTEVRILLIIFISIIMIGCHDSERNSIVNNKYEINYATETGSGKKVKKHRSKNYKNETKGENEI